MGTRYRAETRACQPNWHDADWWACEIGAIVRDADAVRGNLRITVAHDRLSLALRETTGDDAGANFHTWAVWGSKKAGATIRREDTRSLQQSITIGSVLAGASMATLASWQDTARARWIVAFLAAVILAGPSLALQRRLSSTASHVLAGNRAVLEDIGLPTARFVAAFHDATEPDLARLASFLETLQPGETENGGQELLRRAYRHYYLARFATTLRDKHQHMLVANYSAILHEHLRLDAYIDAAIPRRLRRWTTAQLLSFAIGQEVLQVCDDLQPLHGSAFPETLRMLTNGEAQAFLAGPNGLDRTPESLLGSAANDWTEIGDRMNYIVDLFRSRHLHDDVFAAPFTPAQLAWLEQGRIPPGPL